MSLFEPSVADFLATHRVARLATADGQSAPHVLPICYVFDGQSLYSALDKKPKRVNALDLKRVRNVRHNPRVAVVVDDYSENWDLLAHVLIQGEAQILEAGEERDRGETMLRRKYPQYHDLLEAGCVILKITPKHVVHWGKV